MDIWDMLIGTDPTSIQQAAQAAQRNLGIHRGMQTLGSLAGPTAAGIGQVAGQQAEQEQNALERGGAIRLQQTGPLAQARMALESAQATNIPRQQAELERHQRQEERLTGWGHKIEEERNLLARFQKVETPMGTWYIDQKNPANAVPVDPIAKAMEEAGHGPGRPPAQPQPAVGSLPLPSSIPPGNPAAVGAAPAPISGAHPAQMPAPGVPPAAPGPQTGEEEPILRKALKGNPQLLDLAEQRALAALPAPERSQYIATKMSFPVIDRAMKALDRRPQAFGPGQDLSSYVRGNKLVSALQQGERNPEDTLARMEVFQSSVQKIHEVGQSRGFSPMEEAAFEQKYVPATTDTAATIRAKLTNFWNDAAIQHNTIKNGMMSQLHNKSTDVPFKNLAGNQGSGTIKMRSPDGREGPVKPEKVEAAKKAGYTVVQ